MDWLLTAPGQLLHSVVSRPYTFLLFAFFAWAAWRRHGFRAFFWMTVAGYGIAWLSEFASIHSGFPYGLYRYLPRRHGLARIRGGDHSRSLVRACLGQWQAGAAPVALLMVGQIGGASGLGGRRYRDLLIESGAIGQRIYLSAESAGLAARNLAAFMDDELNELMGLDGQNEAVVHLTVVGHGD